MYDNVTNNDIVWIRAVFICPIFFENSDPSLHLLIRGVLRPWLKIMLPKIEKKKNSTDVALFHIRWPEKHVD